MRYGCNSERDIQPIYSDKLSPVSIFTNTQTIYVLLSICSSTKFHQMFSIESTPGAGDYTFRITYASQGYKESISVSIRGPRSFMVLHHNNTIRLLQHSLHDYRRTRWNHAYGASLIPEQRMSPESQDCQTNTMTQSGCNARALITIRVYIDVGVYSNLSVQKIPNLYWINVYSVIFSM